MYSAEKESYDFQNPEEGKTQKKAKPRRKRHPGGGWIRTNVGDASGFTVRPL